MIDFESLNDSCLEAFGEPLSFTVAGVSHAVTGVVTRPGHPVTTRSVPQNATLGSVLGNDDLVVQLRTADVTTHGIGKGSTVTVDGRIYRVIHPWRDDGGMTALECRT